jgi:hypothetical protein
MQTLEEQNEEKYHKLFILPQLEEEHQKLDQLKMAKRSIGLEDIKQH